MRLLALILLLFKAVVQTPDEFNEPMNYVFRHSRFTGLLNPDPFSSIPRVVLVGFYMRYSYIPYGS